MTPYISTQCAFERHRACYGGNVVADCDCPCHLKCRECGQVKPAAIIADVNIRKQAVMSHECGLSCHATGECLVYGEPDPAEFRAVDPDTGLDVPTAPAKEEL